MLIDWFTVLAQILNFAILVWLLKRFLYGPILQAMEAREQKIAATMEEARAAGLEAHRLSAELQQEKQGWLEAKAELEARARREVEEWRTQTLAESRRVVERQREAWLGQLSQDREVFLRKLKAQIVDQVMRISEKVLRDLANQDLERQVVQVFLEKLEQDKAPAALEPSAGPLTLQAGFELHPESLAALRTRVARWFPGAGDLRVQVAADLGLGLQLRVGDRKVAWDLQTYLQSLEKEILADLATAEGEKHADH